MRYGWEDVAIMGIGGLIGYFVFGGFHEESFVLWRAQKTERMLTKIEAFSSERATHREQLNGIEKEREVYTEKLTAIRQKCADLRAQIDKLMKSRRDMTKLKEVLKTRRHQHQPSSGGLLSGSRGFDALASAAANRRCNPPLCHPQEPLPAHADDNKSDLILMRHNIAEVIEQLGVGIRGPRKTQYKQMLRNSRDEILARKRTWRIEIEVEEIENQLRTEARLDELKRLGISDDSSDMEALVRQMSAVDVAGPHRLVVSGSSTSSADGGSSD